MKAPNTFVFSVSELNLAAQQLLEGTFPEVVVEGEISNLSRPASGHLYFSLKDAKAQVRSALFRSKNNRIEFEPQNGLLVQVRAKVSLYPDRGDYQLIVHSMALAGEGLLRKRYDELVKKLAAEGLFQEKWKKPLPTLPKHIGVITSPTGAAIRDILSVLKRRFPSIPVLLYPTSVQGQNAAPEIIRALALANQQQRVDVLIVARGGGSLEDLWPFNEEAVARAVFESAIPIITGIGHEVDFTISDFVADRRAPTPSAAAELITPNQAQLTQQFSLFEKRLIQACTKGLQHRSQKLDWILKRLSHPGQYIATQLQRLTTQKARLSIIIQHTLQDKMRQYKTAIRTLEAISPLATISRGFAIVSLAKTKQIVRSIKEITPGDELTIKLQDGEVKAQGI